MNEVTQKSQLLLRPNMLISSDQLLTSGVVPTSGVLDFIQLLRKSEYEIGTTGQMT